MEVDGKQRTMDPSGRPIGQPVEKYGHVASQRRYRCEKCGSINIDQFHVEGAVGRDSLGYSIKGRHDEEGLACGGRCWPWVAEGATAPAGVGVEQVAEAIGEGLGAIGERATKVFGQLFKR